jgi:outer membrane lipoprotein carrier protein
MNHFRIVIAFLFCMWLSVCHAQTSSSDLSTLLNSIHAMRASFIQTTYDNKNKPIQQSSGRMALVRPGKFRWEVEKPIPQIIIANESKLWIYDPDLEQVTIRSLKMTTGETPALLLSHENSSLEKDFAIRSTSLPSHWKWYQLTPKNADNMFAQIELGFLKNQIKEMRLKDHLGHTIRVQFQKIQINPNLSSHLFSFQPSKNIDVIDETKKNG